MTEEEYALICAEIRKRNGPDIREYLTQQSIEAFRISIIEECAQAVRNMVSGEVPREVYFILGQAIAAIRALKEDKQ